MMINQFRQLAAYNRWANARLYAAALAMPDETYRRQAGVFFGGLHGTLNHLLLTDRIWLRRLTGQGEHPNNLDAFLYDNRADLTKARIAEDARLIAVIGRYDEAALSSRVTYQTTSGKQQEQVLADVLLASFQSSDPPPWPRSRVLFNHYPERAAVT